MLNAIHLPSTLALGFGDPAFHFASIQQARFKRTFW
jgi:hypothetical protein